MITAALSSSKNDTTQFRTVSMLFLSKVDGRCKLKFNINWKLPLEVGRDFDVRYFGFREKYLVEVVN